jgi:hypothetical protein
VPARAPTIECAFGYAHSATVCRTQAKVDRVVIEALCALQKIKVGAPLRLLVLLLAALSLSHRRFPLRLAARDN